MLVFVCVFVIFVVALLVKDVKKPDRYPPGPRWLPVVGNLLTVHRKRLSLGYYHLVWESLAQDYGPIVGLRLGRDLVIIVTNVEGIREVLTRDEFNGRPDGFFFRMRTFGKRLGIVFCDGDIWQQQRKFSTRHLKNFGFGRREMEEQVTEEVKALIDNLRNRCSNPVQVHNLFDITVINVLWSMMAGQRFDLDDSKLKELLGIIHDVFRSTDISGGLLNQMPFLRYVMPEISGYNQQVDILKRMWNFLNATIVEHKRSLCNSHARDLIDAFLQQMTLDKNKNSTFTNEQLHSLCLDMFMAGSETTSNTLEFIMLYLVKYPEVQMKMQEEMDEIVGKNRTPTLQDRTKLVYVEAVLNEVQRICSVAPVGIAHRALCDTELLGRFIPRGATILTCLYAAHHNPTIWSQPHDFRPERFLNPNTQAKATETPHFAPFGFGRRRCLGESLAKTNLFLVTTALFHNFTVVPVPGFDPSAIQVLDGVTLSPKPFEVVLKPRVY